MLEKGEERIFSPKKYNKIELFWYLGCDPVNWLVFIIIQ